MYSNVIRKTKRVGVWMVAAAVMQLGVVASAQEAGKPQSRAPAGELSGWLGVEFTVASTSAETMPTGGKLSLVFDGSDDVVRLCTRNVTGQKAAWKQDFSKDCAVTLAFTRGTRYCSAEDVKAGDAEVLATCHRLRARDVATQRGGTKGSVELSDVLAFLVNDASGTKSMSILVEAPARMTGPLDSIVVKP